MKLCMLTNTYRPHVGGVARSIETLVTQCRARGHEVRVVAPEFPGVVRGAEEAEGILRVPAIQNFNGSDFSVRVPVPQFLSARIDTFAPDVIHSHHPFLLGDTALRLAYRLHLPLVFTHHTLYENYTHYVPFDSGPLKRFVIRLATDYANCCDAVIAPSESMARLMRGRGVRAPVHVIPTGVDTRAFARGDGPGFRAERGLPRDALVLGHVGRLASEKNLGYLGRAVTEALRAHRDWYFLLVGDGPESRMLRAMFEDAGLGARVLMTGKLTGHVLHDAYGAMDAFLFASQSETQGMVVAEAMAAGNPVIALDGPGVRDVVRDDGNGRLLPGKAEPSAFAAALAALDDVERLDMWRRGALATARDYDQGRCAERVLALYQGLQPGRRGRRDDGDWTWWDRLLGRIDAEWELLTAKADSATGSLRTERPHDASP